MASAAPSGHEHLIWRRAKVDGRPAIYGEAGGPDGIPVVFLHGWGLAHHAYKEALSRLPALGCHVYAPALPGFGGTADLRGTQFSFAGYANWVDRFLDEVGLDQPAYVIGHSFGGGVSIKLAHDHPDRVRTLVLVNSVGGSAWKSGQTIRSMAERPLWDWGIHFPSDVLPLPQLTRVIPVVLEDAVSNLLRNPKAMWKVGNLARQADLRPELEELRERRLPVVVLWGEQDKIIPRASFDALCAAIGSEGEVVPGNHSWLLADPDSFGEVMTNVMSVAQMAQEMEAQDEEAAADGDGSPRGLRRLLPRRPSSRTA
jgi:pimeloyl-ACP methyl ester carboxylesterase